MRRSLLNTVRRVVSSSSSSTSSASSSSSTSSLSASSSIAASSSSLSSSSYSSSSFSFSACSFVSRRGYHSFPDPNEVPQISTAKSDVKKTIDKSTFVQIDAKFKLDTPFPGLPTSTRFYQENRPQTISTTLQNGLTVATEDTHGLMTSFAFLVNRGSAHETQNGSGLIDGGATHMLELLAFRSTKNRTHQQLTNEMEQLGGIVQCVGSREGLLYCVDVLRDNLEPAMDILADTILHPQLLPEEIDECKEIITLQQNEFPGEILSRDAVQLAAYKGSPMGNSHFCSPELIKKLDADVIRGFRKKHFLGGNSFLSAAGVEHAMFLDLVQRKFANLPAGKSEPAAKSTFVGGMVTNERELKEPTFIRISIGFEVGGWHDPMLVATCVLQQLLGGGSSFSAGGPGKGMYTRLYREVLNQYHWVESAEAFVSLHEGAGMMGLDAACPPEHISGMIRVIVDQLTKLAYVEVSDEELSRAKNMLKSMMMMQLESRLVLCEDIARQFATYGFRESPAQVCQKIDAITKQDLLGVARRMLLSPPAVGCVGEDLSKVPTYEDIKGFVETFRSEAKNVMATRSVS